MALLITRHFTSTFIDRLNDAVTLQHILRALSLQPLRANLLPLNSAVEMHLYFTANSTADAPLNALFRCTVELPSHKNTALILRFSLN